MSRILCALYLFALVSCRDDEKTDTKTEVSEVLTIEEFVRLDELMEDQNDDQKLDKAWSEMESRLYATIQSEGIVYYSPESRFHMSHLLRSYGELGSDHIIAKHSERLLAMASVLEWAYMYDDVENSGTFINALEWVEDVKRRKTGKK